jgi:acyl-CoA reductase-like NAD-dependent aldehyde dehydrogenase
MHGLTSDSKLEAGSLWANDHMNISPLAPFGGHKKSGIGYEWTIGGFKSYCNVKTLYLRKRRD